MAFEQSGEEGLRAKIYDSSVKQLAKYAYKWKQLVSVVPTSSWKNSFFRETLTVPSGVNGFETGIPRGADFPNAVVSWENVTSTIKKFGLQTNIDYEDLTSDYIDVRDRTMQRIAEGVAKAVDSEIYATLSEGFPTNVVDIQNQSATVYWDATSAQIVKDIATMKKDIKAYYDNADKFVLVVHPNNEVLIMDYVYGKGSQAPTLGAQMALNGSITNLAGADIITSSIMSVSMALLVVPQRCATWSEMLPLSTDTKSERFKGDTITACEMGTTKLTDPKAVVRMQITA